MIIMIINRFMILMIIAITIAHNDTEVMIIKKITDNTVCYLDNCPASLEQTLPEQVFVNYVLGQYFAGLIW